ncbi:hypothetical protein BJ912DRAFT_954579 [Pholiota molesta]|nr:hypothetical protein BJ912DRAFT_954579 [Pholiota molesta]
MEDDSQFYLAPDDEEEWEWEPDSPEQLVRDLAAIARLERGTIDSPTLDLLRLPDDIISQIFYHACLPIADNEEWRRAFYPLWLGGLCRAWRAIAWATSELWTTVVVRVFHEDVSEYCYSDQAELLEEWLQRTKGRKLDIYFGEAKGNRALAPPLPLMELLAARSEQWQDIHIHLSKNWESLLDAVAILSPSSSETTAVQALTALQPTSLPNLRSIVIEQSGAHTFQIPRISLSLAPSLRTIGLLNVPVRIHDIAQSFPCAQMTQLTLTTRSVWNPQELLSLFPQLQSLYCINSPHIRVSRSFTHQKLQSFSIRCEGYEGHELGALTWRMELPALKTLEIVQPGHIEFTRYLLPFLARSKCNLTSLTLECFLCVEHDLIELLITLDALVELYIRDTEEVPLHRRADSPVDANSRGLGRTFFDVLHPDADAPVLPHLEVFLYQGPLSVHAIDFLEPFVLRSRMRGAQSAFVTDGIGEVALLRQATVVADQYSALAEFSIAEYSDPRYVWEVVRMVEEGVLVLRNMDGSGWS